MGANEQSGSVAPSVTAFMAFTKNLFSQGNQLLDYLAGFQSEDIATDLYDGARGIRDDKAELRRRFSAGTIAKRDVFEQVHKLDQPTRALINTMGRFGKEIARVSELTAGPLLSATNELLRGKLAELDAAAVAYQSDDPAKHATAVTHLDAAISDMEGVMNAATCLRDTIKSHKLACDNNLHNLQH